jgi:hypothetical protein
VRDDHLLVLRHLRVELERGDTELDRLGEADEGAFGGKAEAATMGLEIEVGLLWRYRVGRG